MRKMLFLAGAVLCFALPTWSGPATAQAQAPANRDLARFADELEDLLDDAERRRGAEPGLLRDLRALVRKRAGPWTDRILYDEFEDGDYTRNPAWTLVGDRAEVRRDVGLVLAPDTRFGQAQPAQRQGQGALATELLGAILNQATRGGQGAQPPAQAAAPAGETRLAAQVPTPNAFAAVLEFTSEGTGGQLEFGPMAGDDDYGYRVLYSPGSQRGLELIGAGQRGNSVIDSMRGPLNLEDGKLHEIQFLRAENGEMTVLVDRVERLRAVDRAYSGRFQGFVVGAEGGRFAVRSIAVYGQQ